MNEKIRQVLELSDGVRTRDEIAAIVGLSPRYCGRIAQRYGAPRPKPGPPSGARNPAWVGGRAVTRDGYAVLHLSDAEPQKKEHRHLMEKHLGRRLSTEEVVDHIDGLTLHNALSNLRVFPSNREHLAATLSGAPRWSAAGRENIGVRTDRGAVIEPVDSYRQRKEAGDVRLRQILLVALKLGTDSPFLCGTHHWLQRAGIDLASRPSLERAHRAILDSWGWDRDPLL